MKKFSQYIPVSPIRLISNSYKKTIRNIKHVSLLINTKKIHTIQYSALYIFEKNSYSTV